MENGLEIHIFIENLRCFILFFVISPVHPKINLVSPKWDFLKKKLKVSLEAKFLESENEIIEHLVCYTKYYRIQNKEQAESTEDTDEKLIFSKNR